MIQFKPGDIVCLSHVTRAARAVVTHVKGQKLRRRYLNSPESYDPEDWRHFADFSLVPPKTQPPETLPPMPPIFALKSDATAIGNVLAQNSQGLAVFELRSSLEIILVAPSEIEEVRPYTFKTHRNEHYTCPPGLVGLSDILFIGNTMHCVTHLDTKADHYNPLPQTTRKIPTLEL